MTVIVNEPPKFSDDLPSLPDWVPPLDTGQPSAEDLNDLSQVPRQTVAARNTIIPIIYGRDRMFGKPFVVTVDEDAGDLYVAYGFCQGEIQGYESILIDSNEAIDSGAAFFGFKNIGFETGDKFGWDQETGQAGTVNNTVARSGEYGINIPITGASQLSNRVPAPAEGTVIRIKCYAQRNSSPDADAIVRVWESTTVGGTLSTTAGGNMIGTRTADQTVAGWQLIEFTYTVPAGVVEWAFDLSCQAGTTGTWDYDDVSIQVLASDNPTRTTDGIELILYRGESGQKNDGLLSRVLTGYMDTCDDLAYIVARVPAGATAGFPRLEAVIQGRKVYDPRKDTVGGALGPLVTFTRASEGWFLDWEGIFRNLPDNMPRLWGARKVENLLFETDTLDTAAASWTGAGSVNPVANTYLGPNGEASGVYDLTDDDASGFENISQAITIPDDNARYTLSIYIRKTDVDNKTIPAVNSNLSGGTLVTANIRMDTETGDHTGVGGAVSEDVGDYWRFSWVLQNNGSGNTTLNYTIYPAAKLTLGGGDDSSAEGTTTFFGPQVELTDGQGCEIASEYVVNSSDTNRAVKLFNTDRDGNPLAEGRGLLIESGKTNIIDDSNDITTGNWTTQGAPTLVAAENTLFEGHQGIEFQGAASTQGVWQDQGTFVDTQEDCASVILENIDATVSRIGIYDATAAAFVHRIELTWSTKAVATTDGSGGLGVEDLGIGPNGGEMVRIYVTATGTAAGTGAAGNTRRVWLYPKGVGSVALDAIVHHTQFETSREYAAQPIVTVGTTNVTKAVEDAQALNIPTSFVQNDGVGVGGTMYARAERGFFGTATATGYLMSLNTDNDERFDILASGAGGDTRVFIRADATTDTDLTGTDDSFDELTESITAVALAQDDMEVYTNGVQINTDALVDLPDVDTVGIGCDFNGGQQFNGWIKELRYYNIRQDASWLADATNGNVEEAVTTFDDTLTMMWNFSRDMTLQGVGSVLGEGAHRVDDPTTWEYSANPAICFRDMVENFSGWDILDGGVVELANYNDEAVDNNPRRSIGLTIAKPDTVEKWVKGFRTYMGAFVGWEFGRIRVIPNRPDVEAQGAGVFDGATNTDMFVAEYPAIDFELGESFTVELWARATDVSNTPALISKKSGATGTPAGYAIALLAAGGVRAYLADGTTIVSDPADTSNTHDDNVWRHYTLRYNGDNDTLEVLVDGVGSGTQDTSSLTTILNDQNLVIGNDASGQELTGEVDEVRIWKTARTDQEIQDNMFSEIDSPMSEPDLVGYWKLNDGAGATQARDDSRYCAHMSLAGNADFGLGYTQIIPAGVVMHIQADDLVKDSLRVRRRSLRSVPNSVAVDYEDASGVRWRKERVQADSARVISGAEARRLSRISLPGIHNATQAQREATERLNWYLTDLEANLTLFDEGWQLQNGSIVAVTHPIGLDGKLMRVTRTTGQSGRWTVDLTEYDPAVYSDEVVSDPTLPDTNLGDPLNPPAISNLSLAEELFTYKNGNTGSRVRITFTDTGYPFFSQYLVEGVVNGTKVFQLQTQSNEVVTPPVEELVTTTPVDYDVNVYVLSPFARGPVVTDTVTIQGKLAPPGNVPTLNIDQTAADTVELNWTAATDIDIWRYEIRRGTTSDTWETATQIPGTLLIDGLSTVRTGIPTGTYRFFVKARDSVGNESVTARTADVTLGAPPPPTNLSGFEVASEVRLAWVAPVSGFTERYRVAYDTIPASNEITLDLVDTLRFQTKDVPEGTWQFLVYSQDKNGVESATAPSITVEVTSDADAFLADSYDFDTPSLTNFHEYSLRLDDLNRKIYVTNMGDVFSSSPSDFDTFSAEPLANYHSAGASEWLSETRDFGLQLTGSWNLTTNVVALKGNVNVALELSTDDVSYTTFQGAAKGEFRYARVRITTNNPPGTATAFVTTPTVNLKVNVVPLEESGEGVTSPTVGSTQVLSREYTALKEVNAQPKNKTDSLMAIVDNITIGPNTGIQCDGTNYLQGGDFAELDFGTGDFSIEFWTKHNGSAVTNSILISKRNGSLAGWTCRADYDTEEFEFIIDDGTNQQACVTTGDALPDDGDWHHIAVTVDRGADTVRIYVDGVETAASPFDISTVTGSVSNSVNFNMFASSAGTSIHGADGVLDEVRVWDDVRSAAEVSDNYLQQLDMSQTQANLVGYWKMDGAVGASVGTVDDAHPNNNDLTDTGAGDCVYIDPGSDGNTVQKLNSFDVYIFDIFGQQLAEAYQWNWKAV